MPVCEPGRDDAGLVVLRMSLPALPTLWGSPSARQLPLVDGTPPALPFRPLSVIPTSPPSPAPPLAIPRRPASPPVALLPPPSTSTLPCPWPRRRLRCRRCLCCCCGCTCEYTRAAAAVALWRLPDPRPRRFLLAPAATAVAPRVPPPPPSPPLVVLCLALGAGPYPRRWRTTASQSMSTPGVAPPNANPPLRTPAAWWAPCRPPLPAAAPGAVALATVAAPPPRLSAWRVVAACTAVGTVGRMGDTITGEWPAGGPGETLAPALPRVGVLGVS